jgi:hypothetical protein
MHAERGGCTFLCHALMQLLVLYYVIKRLVNSLSDLHILPAHASYCCLPSLLTLTLLSLSLLPLLLLHILRWQQLGTELPVTRRGSLAPFSLANHSSHSSSSNISGLNNTASGTSSSSHDTATTAATAQERSAPPATASATNPAFGEQRYYCAFLCSIRIS